VNGHYTVPGTRALDFAIFPRNMTRSAVSPEFLIIGYRVIGYIIVFITFGAEDRKSCTLPPRDGNKGGNDIRNR